MRTVILAAAAVLALSSPALAQSGQSQNGQSQGGWGGALDQLNRTVNPNAYPQDRNDRAGDERNVNRDDRRYEGSSGNRRGNAYGDYSDRDLRNQYDRLGEEQRQIRQNRRAIEDEMERRGINR